ncbi:MAG: hypothetical protein JXA30_19255 [Deltaproteobacteria bacterium]|nr:hypothetical protein [Deltaproteobacteria bacterium]
MSNRRKVYFSASSIIKATLIVFCFSGNPGCRGNEAEPVNLKADKKPLVRKPVAHLRRPTRVQSDLPPPSDDVVIKLIDPGKKPLRKLRYAFRAGIREAAKVAISETMSVKTNGKELPETVSPPVGFEIITSVESAKKDQPAKLTLIFGKTSIPNGTTNAQSTLVAEMLKSLEGVPGIQTLTDQGIVKESEIQMPNGANAAVRNLWQGTQRIAQNLIQFPVEPVGVGARWEVTQDISLITSARQITKYELLALVRGGGTVRAEIVQTGRPGLVPEMSNDDIENYLDSFKATGEAELDFKLNCGISFGKVTMTTVASYTSESDTEDNITEYHTVQSVETKRATVPNKGKK